LLFGDGSKNLLSACFAGAQTLRLGTLRDLGWRFGPLALRTLGALAFVAVAVTRRGAVAATLA
jgi:hypothetical protein